MQSMLMRIFLFLAILSLFNPALLMAAAERRIALVIGNSQYTSAPLRNPVNDANDVATALKNLGFKVILKTNASKKEMGKAVEEFGKQLKGRAVGLFFYAGHGVQVNGVNYLIPVCAMINEESDVEYEAIDAGRVLATMYNSKSRVNIVILDACRDNPYARGFRSATRGLAIISKAPMGTIVSYSTSPGDVALDGKGRNSPYTSSLIQYMKEPGLSIEQVFKNVRQKLNKETSGKQVPWELSSLQGEFFFVSGKGKPATEVSESLKMATDKDEQEPTAIDAFYDEQRKVELEKQRLEKEEALLREKMVLKEKRKQLAMGILPAVSTAPVLHGIGVYEGSYPSGVRHSGGYHPDGSIDVIVHTKKCPVILALSSYEPIVWNIKTDDGVVIKEIILSGYHASKVIGVDSSVRITRQSFGFAYQQDADKSELAKKLKEYTGLDIDTFQALYKGKEFSVH